MEWRKDYYKPRIIKNVLTEKEIDELTAAVNFARNNQGYSPVVFKWWGRLSHDVTVPESVKKKFDDIVKSIDPTFNQVDQNSFIYSGIYGKKTHLPPHQDAGGKLEVTLDYQLDANVSWPIIVEGEEFVLENNDLLIFGGASYVHWRTEKFLTEDEHVDMFSVSYARPEYAQEFQSSIETYMADVDRRMAEAHKLYSPSFDTRSCISNDQIDHSRCRHEEL